MRKILFTATLTLTLVLPIGTVAQVQFNPDYGDDPGEVLDRMQRADNAGWRDVDHVALVTDTSGMSTFEMHEKTTAFTLDNGETAYVTRSVPLNELQERAHGGNEFSSASPGELKHAANVIEEQMGRAQTVFEDEMAKNGLGATVIGNMISNPPADQPWLATTPGSMGSLYARFLRGAADAKVAQAEQDRQNALEQQSQEATRLLREHSRLVQSPPIDGRPTIGLLAENLNHTQIADGRQVTFNKVLMTVDAEYFVPLSMKMDGVMVADGETRSLTIERLDQDYRTVPGCGDMYRPFRSVMRLAGLMTPEEQAQMVEAQAQMADMEKQLAQLPESQRAMIMQQMGPQMEMLKGMAESGGFSVESKILTMKCDIGAPAAMQMAMSTVGGGMLGDVGSAMTGRNTRPYYIDEKGIGVIRHAGEAGEYFLNVKGSGDVLAGPMGPYKGPNVGIYIGSLSMIGLPFDQIELELYRDDPQRTSVLFKPEVNAARAESKEHCGEISPIGECSN